MNLANATLTNIATPGAADAWGQVTYGAGTTVDVRCLLDVPSRAQTMALAERISQASAVLYILKSALPGGTTIAPRTKLAVTIDGGVQQSFEVVHSIDREKSGGLSHWELFVKVTK